MPVYDEKYRKVKVREFNPNDQNKHFRWWSAKRKRALQLHSLHNYWFCYTNGKKDYPEVYLEECKYKINKIKMTKFIDTELESESELQSETESELKSELEFDTE